MRLEREERQGRALREGVEGVVRQMVVFPAGEWV
jgi:hypothetical protein